MPTPAKSHQPDGCHAVTPYLIIKNAAKAIEFYQKAFGAKELFRMPTPDGKIAHAEVQIGDTRIMLADENAECEAYSPEKFGGCSIGLLLYIKDVDTVFAKAISFGAKEKMPVTDKFYGDRSGCVLDPFGYTWHISTHTQELTPEEIEAAAQKFHSSK